MQKFLTTLALLVSTPAMAEKIPNSDISSGNWQGAAYTFEDTQSFSHCAISASYNSGDTLLFSVNAGATVSVGLISAGINLPVGDSFPVRLHVDKYAPISATATVTSLGMAVLQTPDIEYALTIFKKGRALSIESPIGWGHYNLTGTYKALEVATACALHYYQLDQNKPRTSPDSANPADTVDRTALFQVATSLISDMGIRDFKYLTPEESWKIIPTTSVFWRSDSFGLLGGVMVLPLGDAPDLRSTDAGDISFLASFCDGEFATTATQVTSSERPMRQISSMCIQGENRDSITLTKIQFDGEILYTLIAFDGAEVETAAKSPPQDAYLRAASYYR